MLFEQRCYSFKPGAVPAFWQAQIDRGFNLVQPIQQRLVGYFQGVTGPLDQVTHLYRYDSFDDWKQRLHGLYGVPALEPYFRTVRALMSAQQNQFFTLAPVTELNPIWGEGRDWTPDQPSPTLPRAAPDSLVEETTTVLLPGAMPAYWQAWRSFVRDAELLDAESLMVSLVSMVGRQHQVVVYRQFPDMKTRDERLAVRQDIEGWRALQKILAPMVVSQQTRLMRPAPLAELAPLFYQS